MRRTVVAGSCIALAVGVSTVLPAQARVEPPRTPGKPRVIYLKPKTSPKSDVETPPAADAADVEAAGGTFPGPNRDIAGPVARQGYSVADFDSIRVEAPVEIIVSTGRGVSASGTGDRATLDALTFQTAGRVLVVRMTRTPLGSDRKRTGGARVQLTTRSLNGAALLGAGSLSVDRMAGGRVNVSLRGSGRLDVDAVAADRLDIGLLGAGALRIAGTAGDVNATLSGSGRFDGARLTAKRLRLDSEGSVLAAAGATETARVTAAGSSGVTITGTRNCTVRTLGSAAAECDTAR